MKLVNSHVMTVSGVGDVMESEFSYNSKMSAVPHGPCLLRYDIILLIPFFNTFSFSSSFFSLNIIETHYELTNEMLMMTYLALVK